MTYSIPQKTILTRVDLENFQASTAKTQLLDFIQKLANSVTGITLSSEVHLSKAVQDIIQLILKLREIISRNPPVEQKSRYGNNIG